MIETLVGLNVTNDEDYTNYRKGMTPLLTAIGGSFGYDLKIAEVLKSETENKINRVFTIQFPDKEKMDSFFSDPEYKKIKEQYFEGAVESTTIMASYER